ncbi:hypothetical protein V9T40_008737 [Parthenolecanium corni]|uniref:Uncharacterized protein n=1 Tax=Parthenolecanium corni TaxID=536013 RepID=A0AAN9Y6W7_9HEMI
MSGLDLCMLSSPSTKHQLRNQNWKKPFGWLLTKAWIISRCATGACIDSSHVCDGYKHCNVDGSDEAAEQCKNNVYVSA